MIRPQAHDGGESQISFESIADGRDDGNDVENAATCHRGFWGNLHKHAVVDSPAVCIPEATAPLGRDDRGMSARSKGIVGGP